MPAKGKIRYSQDLELDLSTVVPSVAGPKRPQDRIELPNLKQEFVSAFSRPITENGFGKASEELSKSFELSPASAAHAGGGSLEPIPRQVAISRNTKPHTEMK